MLLMDTHTQTHTTYVHGPPMLFPSHGHAHLKPPAEPCLPLPQRIMSSPTHKRSSNKRLVAVDSVVDILANRLQRWKGQGQNLGAGLYERLILLEK